MRKWVVVSEVQLEEGVFLWRVSPERAVYGRLAAEAVDRFADRLGANVSGVLYGVEVGRGELMSRCTFLRLCGCGCGLFGCIVRILHRYGQEIVTMDATRDASYST